MCNVLKVRRRTESGMKRNEKREKRKKREGER